MVNAKGLALLYVSFVQQMNSKSEVRKEKREVQSAEARRIWPLLSPSHHLTMLSEKGFCISPYKVMISPFLWEMAGKSPLKVCVWKVIQCRPCSELSHRWIPYNPP